MSSNWIIISIVVSLIYVPIVYFGIGRYLQPLARKVLTILTIVEFGLVFLHLVVFANNVQGFWLWFLDLGSEFALGATFSAAQLLAVGLTALIIARYASGFTLWHRLYWIMLGMLFTILNLDEYYLLHDSIEEILFVALAVVGMVVILAGYWLNFRHERKLFMLLFGGLAIMAFALASDAVLPNVPQQSAMEEFMEMNGVTIVLIGFLAYAHDNLSPAGYRSTKRIPLLTSIFWACLLSVIFWIVPTIEYKLVAQPVRIEYLDGDLALVGYRFDQDKSEPGDTVDLTLYWEVARPVPLKYGTSAHLLTHPDVKSVFQSDHLLITYHQTDAWIPGLITRLPIKLQIPDHDSTPFSYWLQLTVWNADGYDPIHVTNHNKGWLLDEESLVLLGYPVLTDQTADVELTEAAYQFGDQFNLSGYSLPDTIDSQDSLLVHFRWQTGDDNVQEQYTQFVHIFSEDEFVTGFDAQPFAGRFPTSDWPRNVEFTDTLDMPLPQDLSAGDYDVFTGMYNTNNQERLSITEDGVNLPNGLVYLGTVRFR